MEAVRTPETTVCFSKTTRRCITEKLNVVVEWETLLLLIPEVPGSHLGPKTGYPD
jgi:hypothetical protein